MLIGYETIYGNYGKKSPLHMNIIHFNAKYNIDVIYVWPFNGFSFEVC